MVESQARDVYDETLTVGKNDEVEVERDEIDVLVAQISTDEIDDLDYIDTDDEVEEVDIIDIDVEQMADEMAEVIIV